jgi:hypothetical protein
LITILEGVAAYISLLKQHVHPGGPRLLSHGGRGNLGEGTE